MAPDAVGFVRVKLLQCERGTTTPPAPGSSQTPSGPLTPFQPARPEAEVFDPYVAVKVKEAETTPGE